MWWINFTWLGIVSVVLAVLWAGLRIAGKQKAAVLFVLAYGLLYVDYLALKNHFNFEIVAMLLVITALVAGVQLLRYKKVHFSKELAIYLLLSAVHGSLYLLVQV